MNLPTSCPSCGATDGHDRRSTRVVVREVWRAEGEPSNDRLADHLAANWPCSASWHEEKSEATAAAEYAAMSPDERAAHDRYVADLGVWLRGKMGGPPPDHPDSVTS